MNSQNCDPFKNRALFVKWFFDFSVPCFFEECEKLREEYRKDRNSSKCLTCDEILLYNKYRQQLVKIWDEKYGR